MKGICFKEPLFHAVIERRKTQILRHTNRYKQGEIICIREPYFVSKDCPVMYKYDHLPEHKDIVPIWFNKFFMPEELSRFYIKINDVRTAMLHEVVRNSGEKNTQVWVYDFELLGKTESALLGEAGRE